MEVKQEAVRLVEEEHMTYATVADKLNIRKRDRIKAWVRMYRREVELSFHKPIGRPVKTESEEREVKRLRMEKALLKNPYRVAGAFFFCLVYWIQSSIWGWFSQKAPYLAPQAGVEPTTY